jgi:uncharacterized protein (DUF2267 family)
MDDDSFLSIVERWAAVDRETAARATRATLQTLAERLSKGEAIEIGRQLPEGLAPFLWTETGADRFDVDEFLRRVAEREGVDVPTAETHARAVFAALRRSVRPDEFADLVADLPDDFKPLEGEVEIMPAAEFVHRVAKRTGLDTHLATETIEAVLETLASRIAEGEVDDLISRLPAELHPPLKQGKSKGKGAARRMSAVEFVSQVAHQKGVSLDQATEYVRAVLATLREAVGDDEYFDVTVALPPDYEPLLIPERQPRS